MKFRLGLILILLFIAFPVWAELGVEVGASYTLTGGADSQSGAGLSGMLGLHAGYNWSILYVTWDSILAPPDYVNLATNGGVTRPGFLNLLDGGVRVPIGRFVLLGEAGFNTLYIMGQAAEDFPAEMRNARIGVNLRAGGGFDLGFLSVYLVGTMIFPSFRDMGEQFGGVFNRETWRSALSRIGDGIVPSIIAVFQF